MAFSTWATRRLEKPSISAIGQGALRGCSTTVMASDFLARWQAGALVDVEQADLGDELAVDAAGGAQQGLGRQRAVDDKGEIALDRLEHRQLQRRLGAAGARLGHGVEKHLEGGNRRA